MNQIFTVLLVFISSNVFAGTYNLGAGEVVTIKSNTETTVTCGANAAPVQQIIYRFCECYSVNLNGRDIVQALMKTKTSDSPYEAKDVMKEFPNSFGAEGSKKCDEFIKTVPACGNRR